MRNFTSQSSFWRMPKIPPLSVAQASKASGIPKRTIQAAIVRRDLDAHKLPGKTGSYVIDPRDLNRWLAKRERAAS